MSESANVAPDHDGSPGSAAGSSGASRAGGPDWFTIALMVACAALAALVVILARENRRLKAEITSPPGPRSSVIELKPGDPIGPLTLIRADGARQELAFDTPGQRTLLLVYSQGCHICDLMKPIWKRVAPPDGPALRVISLSADREPRLDAAEAAAAPGLLAGVVDPAATAMARLRIVPATLLIDDQGRVERAWWGFEGESTERDLVQALANLRALNAAAD